MAFAAAGAAIAGLASNAISAASSKGQQARAYNYARLLQQQQYDLGIRGYKEAPSAQRQGMEDAGFNPMLAVGSVGNGVNVAGGTPVSANSTDTSGIKESISQAIQLRNQTNQTEALTDDYYASADLKKAEKATLIEKLPYVSKQAKADYQKTAMESAKLENDIHYQNELINYYNNSLKLQETLGYLGNATQRRGQDISYNASTYSSNVQKEIGRYANLIRDYEARTNRNRKSFSIGKSGISGSFSHQ